MKLDDVVEVNLVDRSPKETYRPVREMAAKIITEDVEIRIYVKGGFKLSFYGGLKLYDLGGLRTDRC